MDWNPADEFLGPEPDECEACEGSGVVVFGITVYEPGCGYSYESTDERTCDHCQGTGKAGNEPFNYYRIDSDMVRALEADGEKLRQLTGQDHGPWFDEEIPF